MRVHIKFCCPETVICCEYKKHGCDEKMKRKDLKSHLDNSMAVHLRLIRYGFANLEKRCENLEEIVGDLQAKMERLYSDSEEDECQDDDLYDYYARRDPFE